MNELKILVVGAGIAGPTICYWLKRFGFSPFLIEKNNTMRKNGLGLDIRGSAIAVIKRMGIYKSIAEMHTQINHDTYVDTKGNILIKEQSGYRQGEDCEIMRGDLMNILMQSIKEVPCYFNKNIIHIAQNNENVEVTFEDNKTENYDLIIGADGLRSATRNSAFSKDQYKLIDLGSYISVFSVPNYLRLNGEKIIFESNQKIISVTANKNSDIALVAIMFRSNHTLRDMRDEKEQKDFLKCNFLNLGWETNKLLDYMEVCDDFYFDKVMQVQMQSWSTGRIALVGDSAYCPSPLSGQGTSLALVGAYILAGELKTARGDYTSAFNRYHAVLDSFVTSNQNLGIWVNDTFLLADTVSKDSIKTRMDNIFENLKIASHAIHLPEYE